MPDGTGDFASRLTSAGVPFRFVRGMRRPRSALHPFHNAAWLGTMPGSVSSIRRIIEESGIDIVHQNHPYHLQGALAARLSGKRVVWHIHGIGHPRLAKLFRPVVRRLAHRIVASSAYTGRMFLNLDDSERDADEFDVLYPPIDVERYAPNGLDVCTKEEFGFGESDPVVATIGHINPLKGHQYFIRAAAQIRHEVPSARFMIVGGNSQHHGKYEAQLHEETRSLGLEGALVFTGARSDLPRLMGAIDVVVNTSNTEGVSLALGEAMASEKPVVATNVGGTPELIQHGESGILVPLRDPDAVAGAVIALLKDPEWASTIASQGREVVRSRFSSEQCALRYAEIYQRLLDE